MGKYNSALFLVMHNIGEMRYSQKKKNIQISWIHSSSDGRLSIAKVEVGEVNIVLSNVYAPTENIYKPFLIDTFKDALKH